MQLTHDVLERQHSWDLNTCIMGTVMINAYLIHLLSTKKI